MYPQTLSLGSLPDYWPGQAHPSGCLCKHETASKWMQESCKTWDMCSTSSMDADHCCVERCVVLQCQRESARATEMRTLGSLFLLSTAWWGSPSPLTTVKKVQRGNGWLGPLPTATSSVLLKVLQCPQTRSCPMLTACTHISHHPLSISAPPSPCQPFQSGLCPPSLLPREGPCHQPEGQLSMQEMNSLLTHFPLSVTPSKVNLMDWAGTWRE